MTKSKATQRMDLGDLLGRVSVMRVIRLAPPGAYVAPEGEPEGGLAVLVPAAEVPAGCTVGAELEVFVYLDSEDRPVATTRAPTLEIGEVTFLEVTSVTRIGAFVAWGLQKDLLVPFAEQTRELRVGDRDPIGLYVDSTGRLAGTMRISEMLGVAPDGLVLDEWVEGEAWRKDPDIGVFVIVERSWVGLVPKSEPSTLVRGQAGRFRVTRFQPDGRVELSLRGHAHLERDKDAEAILAAVRTGTRIGDASSPDEIRYAFGLSKKAFKRAVGGLLRAGAVSVDDEGMLVARPVSVPGSGGA